MIPRAAVILPFAAVVAPALLVAGFILFVTQIAPYALNNQPLRKPSEPFIFPHDFHVQTVGIECAFCHRGADKGMAAGYPDVEQCMFCHSVAGTGKAGVEMLRTAYAENRPIDWERIHRMPDHVHFVHEAHIKAGFGCATCHGDVKSMQQVTQVRRLNMGDCVDCHRQNNAPTECVACHY